MHAQSAEESPSVGGEKASVPCRFDHRSSADVGAIFRDEEFIEHLKRVAASQDDLPPDLSR